MLPTPTLNATTSTPVLFWWSIFGAILLALVPTLWPQLDLAAASLFMGNPPLLDSKAWWWIELINLYLPALFRVWLVLCLLAWLYARYKKATLQWRLALAFVAVAGTVGPGLIVNLGFKDNWQRARPYQVENFGGTQLFTRATVVTDQCDNNCSFVSGHVACGFFLASLMLVHRRRAKTWLVVGALAGVATGFARMSAGAHWLSDVLWAFPITMLSSWLVWRALLWTQRQSKPE
ncbi:phosphatase PAP2 family protein [Rhodoferax aquaticus]|uniref:Phosphatase PAP2 family protein n=1 Tax=Rhodoferax aquaticus TaxID=2527691 RepID=A0A515ESC8_9BURK|nr:phosphatase PAP2 family protein [Rhodoferax aquaticus]QDL55513.1 phosphatase PAP2 family protein [Rhodoferax aquaticus]